MKLFKLGLIFFLATSLVACSGNKKKGEDVESEEVSQVEDSSAEDADFIVDSDEDLLADEESVVEEQPGEEVAMTEESSAPVISGSSTYTVEKGDTLMMIAFKLYGDYRKWKEVAELNPGLSPESLAVGMTINHNGPGFEWNPEGLPHLVKRGETLGVISTEKYGTDKRWKDIWNNNRPLIRDPNLIFAGFTIYYVPDRELASEEL